jgi:bifunctional non-homologous end joining protein LigD
MFATPGPLPEGSATGGEWRYEVHWAGLRVLVEVTGGEVRLTSRTERDITAHFPEFAGLGDRLRDGLFDAEIIILDRGVPSPGALAERLRVRDPRRLRRLADRPDRPAGLMVFDVLRLYGVPLLHRPLDERRSTLERVGVDGAERVALSPVYDDGPALLAATERQRLPGVVAKLADSPYRPGVRDPSWVEVTHGPA